MKPGTSIVGPQIVNVLPRLSSAAVRLGVALGKFENQNGTCWPSERRLMQVSGIADWRTFRKARDELGAIGLRWIPGKGRATTRYSWQVMPVVAPVTKERSTCKHGV